MDIKNGVTPVESEPTAVEAPEAPATEEGQGNEPQTPTGETVEGLEEPKDHNAFAQMRIENKRLKEELARREGTPQSDDELERVALNELRSPGVVHPESGFTPDMPADEAMARMTNAERLALESAQETQNLKMQLENERLYSKFPELNPQHEDYKKPSTKVFEELLAGQYVIERMNGRNPDLLKLAEKVKSSLAGANQTIAEEASQKTLQELNALENASLEARGSSTVIPQSKDREALRERSRKGDVNAMADMLLEDELKGMNF